MSDISSKKIAIVTGGSRGIGAEICKKLASNNYKVVLCYFNSEEKAKEIADGNENIEIYKIDLKDENQINNLVSFVIEKYSKIDLLVNNAGIDMFGMFQDFTAEDLYLIMKTNLFSAMFLSREVSKNMISQKSGSIINISSIYGTTGASCESLYAVSKAGLDGLTKSLALELGPSNVRVNSIAPGIIDTDMNARLSQDEINSIVQEIPLGKIGTPGDVAEAVVLLENCKYITGQIIEVNGGWHM